MVTDRRIRLPEPYPDENCYSILCRYTVRSGWLLSSNQASIVLYGNTMPLSGLLYKPFRMADLKRWRADDGRGSYGKDHSCLQYFAAFLDTADAGLVRQCRNGMVLTPGLTKGISRKCGLTQLRKKHLWYCPLCAREDFRIYGETYWRRLCQMPGVSYCPKHRVRLLESGLPISETNYQLFPASYVLLHVPDTDGKHSGNVFEREFIQVAEDTKWLLENGFDLPDNTWLRAEFLEKARKELDEHAVYPSENGKATRFGQYLAARVLKESGRKNLGVMVQKYLSTIVSVEGSFGSIKDFWQS